MKDLDRLKEIHGKVVFGNIEVFTNEEVNNLILDTVGVFNSIDSLDRDTDVKVDPKPRRDALEAVCLCQDIYLTAKAETHRREKLELGEQ